MQRNGVALASKTGFVPVVVILAELFRMDGLASQYGSWMRGRCVKHVFCQRIVLADRLGCKPLTKSADPRVVKCPRRVSFCACGSIHGARRIDRGPQCANCTSIARCSGPSEVLRLYPGPLMAITRRLAGSNLWTMATSSCKMGSSVLRSAYAGGSGINVGEPV